jgi:2-(1,2-epoxy-1,2-dihydrophenyl)acetyl-CoA isomerase
MTAAEDRVAFAQRLYDALGARDPAGIAAALDPAFVGVVSDGMPVGAGRHDGAQAMIRDCWEEVFKAFDVALKIDERLTVDDDRLVFTGRYVGCERGTGRRVDAAFAHVLRLRGNQVVALRQYTDTARWGVPDEPSA